MAGDARVHLDAETARILRHAAHELLVNRVDLGSKNVWEDEHKVRIRSWIGRETGDMIRTQSVVQWTWQRKEELHSLFESRISL